MQKNLLPDQDFSASFAFLTTFGQIMCSFRGYGQQFFAREKDKLCFLRSSFAALNGQTLLLITGIPINLKMLAIREIVWEGSSLSPRWLKPTLQGKKLKQRFVEGMQHIGKMDKRKFDFE